MTDTRTSPSPDKTRKPITSIQLTYNNLPPRAGYFVVSVHRGDWNTSNSRVRFYYRPSRASLLRINRAQRLLIRRVVNGYVAALPTVTVEPENNTELGQLITTEWEAAEQPVRMCAVTDCLNAADPAQQQRTADSLWGREDEPEQPATEQAPAAPQSQAQQAWAAAVVDAVALGIAVPNMDPAADDADVAKAAGKLRKQIDAARKTAQPA